jgi:phasin family protein
MTVKIKKAAPAVASEAVAAAAQSYETAIAAAKEHVEKASTYLFRGYDDIAALNQGNVEALVKANTVLAKGAEEIGKELMSYAQTSLERTAGAAKALFGAKTLQDVVQLNTEFAKNSYDTYLANATKLGELSVKVANEAFQPLSQRATVAFEKLGKPIAA